MRADRSPSTDNASTSVAIADSLRYLLVLDFLTRLAGNVVDVLVDRAWCTLESMFGFDAGALSAGLIFRKMPAVVDVELFYAHLDRAKL